MDTVTKTCIGCGREFERGRGQTYAKFESQKYCSRACVRNESADKPRPPRVVTGDTKVCEMCGKTFSRPANQRGKTWESRKYCSVVCVHAARKKKAWDARPVRVCPICDEEFRSALPIKNATTCGKTRCKQRYRREVAAPKVAKKMREAYVSGVRVPASGVSGREILLWEHLRDLGWTWQMRWFDVWGSFELDFSIPDLKINVEIDGPEHRTGTRRERDVARDAELVRRGWRILRVSNGAVDASPEAVVEEILGWAAGQS